MKNLQALASMRGQRRRMGCALAVAGILQGSAALAANDDIKSDSDAIKETVPEEVQEQSEAAAAARDIFAKLDTDSSGDISHEEARRSFVVLKLYGELDENGDELVRFEEFDELRLTHMISDDGNTVIPKAKDAKPEEAWTGGKTRTEASAQQADDAGDAKTTDVQ